MGMVSTTIVDVGGVRGEQIAESRQRCAFLWRTTPIAALGHQILSWMDHWSVEECVPSVLKLCYLVIYFF